MDKDIHSVNFNRFVYGASIEILIAGIFTAFLSAEVSIKIVALAVAIAAIGGVGLFIPGQLSKRQAFSQKILVQLQKPFVQRIPVAVVLLIPALLFALDLNVNLVRILSPLLACLWLIGVEFLFVFTSEKKDVQYFQPDSPHKGWVALGMLLVIGVILVPTRMPSLLDGIPIDTPFEFILLLLVLPFAFILGRKFFAKKVVLWTLGFLLTLKLLALLLPQSGMGVRAYSSEEALTNDQWEKSYSTFLPFKGTPSYTQVTQSSYYSYRELPMEWVNRNGFMPDDFWIALRLNGFVRLQGQERFVLLVEGAKETQAQMVDSQSVVAIVENANQIDSDLYQQLPEVQDFELRAYLTFESFGQYRVEPLVVYPDGSTKSALDLDRIWISPTSVNVSFIQPLLNLIGLGLAALLGLLLVLGLADFYRANQITAVDLYLGASALLVFYFAQLIPRPAMNIALLGVVGVLSLIKWTEHSISHREFSWMEFIVSLGPIFLLVFLALDIYNLREVVIFPQKQDGLEYQLLARNIYLRGDVFLTQTPPRAYKVLFPYVVGLLHILFGQSAAAQFFLNAWYALLAGGFVVKLSNAFRYSARMAVFSSFAFLLILFLPSSYIFYFRFGLIEPVAVMLLLATFYFAITRNIPAMFAAGILTSLFRLDYFGGILSAVILTSIPMVGDLKTVWGQILSWFKENWKLLVGYILAVVFPSILIILGYYLFVPNYELTATVNNQSSISLVFDSLMIVIVGGDMNALQEKFTQGAVDALFIAIPVALGFLIALVSFVYRKGFFKKIDLRLSLLIWGILPAYIAVHPTAYFPRYSWTPLPLALMLIAVLLHGLFSKHEQDT
jgi:hypothetical protein